MKSSLLFLIIALLLILVLTSCSPGYVIRAAYEESKILINREEISEILKDEKAHPNYREKLRYVQDARDFAIQLGLDPKRSFTKYTEIDREVLSWVVMASKKDAFELYTWWFPFVGSVPYKGYFEKEDADESAKSLEEKGYESWVRPTDAFSTLGWFNDPILSTTLKRSIPEIVETVIHESVHATVWFKGSRDHSAVEFNESLAQFIGILGGRLFFERKLAACTDEKCKKDAEMYLLLSQNNIERSIEFSIQLEQLYKELQALYGSDLPSDEKIKQRDGVFEAAMGPFRKKFPNLKNFNQLNNAQIMQSRIYYTKYPLLNDAFMKSNKDLITFIEASKKLRDTSDDAKDLFEQLRSLS